MEDGLSFGVDGNATFALVRYNTDGTLDTTFGGDGRVTADFTPLSDFCSASSTPATFSTPSFHHESVAHVQVGGVASTLDAQPCRMVAASASNFLSLQNDEVAKRWLADSDASEALLDWELRACADPAVIGAGTHILAVVERIGRS